jgi:hypothetical protein
MKLLTNMAVMTHLAQWISLEGINALSLLDKHLFVFLKILTFTLSLDDMEYVSDAVIVRQSRSIIIICPTFPGSFSQSDVGVLS